MLSSLTQPRAAPSWRTCGRAVLAARKALPFCNIRRSAAQKEGSSVVDQALESLDNLLSSDEEPAAPQKTARAARNATRQTSTQSYVESRFMNIDRNWTTLAVGQQTAVGASTAELPTSEPGVSYVVAGWVALSSCAAALFPSFFPAEASVMYPELAEDGNLHQFLTASFICPTLANCALGVLLLLTAGGSAERVLGRGRFALTYLLAGATANVWYYALSEVGDPSAYFCGVAGGVVGVSSALAAVVAKNRRMLSGGQAAKMVGVAAGAAGAAVLGDALLWQDHSFIGGAYVAPGLAGVVLGAAMSPRYEIVREVLIPDGSVEVPDDAPEVQVVVDKTDALQQWGACVAFAVVLALFTHGITSVSVETLGLESDGVLLELMGRALLLGDPDAAQELYTAAPEDWPLQV